MKWLRRREKWRVSPKEQEEGSAELSLEENKLKVAHNHTARMQSVYAVKHSLSLGSTSLSALHTKPSLFFCTTLPDSFSSHLSAFHSFPPVSVWPFYIQLSFSCFSVVFFSFAPLGHFSDAVIEKNATWAWQQRKLKFLDSQHNKQADIQNTRGIAEASQVLPHRPGKCLRESVAKEILSWQTTQFKLKSDKMFMSVGSILSWWLWYFNFTVVYE